MRKFLSFFLLVVVGVYSDVAYGIAPSGNKVAEGFSELSSKLLPAVVNISTEQTINDDSTGMGDNPGFRFPGFPKGIFEEFFNNIEPLPAPPSRPRKVVSLGSGFIIDSSGLIVTNYHVIANAKEIHVKFSDNSTANASVLGKDLKTDLAVLKVDVKKDLHYVKLGDSDSIMVGDWVLAIGNPFGLGGSVSVGIISGRSRDINIGTGSEFLQTDAAINRGHSGGPLFNMNGEVVGINTAIMSPQGGGNVGIAFAIPSNNASRIIDLLSKGKKVEHGWLGVTTQYVTEDMIDSLGLKEAKGALISSVTKDSPAYKAGLKPGDVVLEFDGKGIESMPQLIHLVAKTEVDKKVKMVIQRNGQVLKVSVVICKLPEDLSAYGDADEAEVSYEELGLTVGGMPKNSKQKKPEGVMVLRVDRSSDAFSSGVRRGDILLGINSSRINDIADFKGEVKRLKQAAPKGSVLLLLKKGDSPPVYVPVKLKNA